MDKIKRLLFSDTSRDTAISFVGSGAQAVFGTIFTILLARNLAPNKFGIFSSIAAVVMILVSLGDLGISSALINFIPKIKGKRKELVATSFWFQLIIAASIGILFIALSPFHSKVVPGSLIIQFVIGGVLITLYTLNGFTLGLLRAEKKFVDASIVMTVDSAVKVFLVVALFFANKVTISLALVANIVSVAISTFYGFRHELKKLPLILPKLYLKKIFSFAKWIGLSRAFGVAVTRVDIILLNLLDSSFSAGIFAAAGRVAMLFALIVSSLGSVVAPRFSAFQNKNETESYLKKLFLLITAISLSMFIAIALARPIITIVFGQKYLSAIPVFQALTLAMIPFLYSIATTNPIIYTFNQPAYFAKLTVLQVLIMVGLDILLIPSLGAMAPAISIGVSNLIILVLSGIKLNKLLAKIK